MQGRTFPLPALLALSVATALGSGTLALASRTKATGSTQTSSWECSAGLHQDWSCSPGVGEPYTKPLEQVRKYSKTMRSGLDHIMQQAISPSQELSQVEEEVDLIPNYSEDDPVLGQLPDTAFDPDSNKEYRPSPSRSLADNDWVSRLTSTSSWPEDQSRLPGRRPEPEQDKLVEAEVTEEEVSRSVLLSGWLKRAQKKSSWVNKEEADDTAAVLLGKREEFIERATGEPGQAPVFDKEREVYADKWLGNAAEKAVWKDLDKEINTPPPDISVASLSNPTAALEEAEQEAEGKPNPEDERATEDMKLVGSVTFDGGEPIVEAPLVATVSDSSPLLPSEKEKFKPHGLGYNLLAHQASDQPKGKYGGKDSIPPLSVQIAQQTMPAFQMQLRQAQQKGTAQTSYPQTQFTAPEPANSETIQPRLIQRGSLPDLEVTPAERLYKAAPQPSIPSNRQMPWKKHVSPEQWQHAPSGTQIPSTGHYVEGPAVFASAKNIELPKSAHYRRELPPSSKTEAAQDSLSVRSWSLTGENVAHVSSAKIVTPLPDSDIRHHQPEPDWPEPQYKADNRLAPAIPSYANKTLWPGAENNRMMRKAKPAVSPDTLRSYRRPPPVSPKDIYRLSTQEPTSVGRPVQSYEKETPFTQTAKKQPAGPSSVDRLRQKTKEPTAALEPQRPTPTPLPKVMAGLQQANFTVPVLPTHSSTPATLTDMLSAPVGSVSIQWLATTQPGQIYTLQKRYPLLQQATIARFNSSGQTWYILLYGIYPDASAARAALRNFEWQGIAKRLNPWTRPLSGLKKLDLVRTSQSVPLTQQEHRTLPQGAYTIQWMKSDAPGVLRDIRDSNPLLSTAEIVLLSRKSSMQYVLIQGRYSSNLAVKQVLNNPQFLNLARHLQAKPRTMASLRNSTQLSKKPVFTQVSVPMDQQTTNILMAPEGSFTIQWLAANKPRMLNQLKQRYPELENAELVHFRRNQKDWYVLVQGQYASSHEARQVLNSPELQHLASQLRPWARSVAGLRRVTGS